MRAHGLIVNDCPKQFSKPDEMAHSIYVPNLDLNIPLSMNGVISYIPVRYPTSEEIETCVMVELTSQDVRWEPYSENFLKQEENDPVSVSQQDRTLFALRSNCPERAVFSSVSNTLDDDLFTRALLETPKVTLSSNTTGTKRHSTIDEETLSKRWGIGYGTAAQTLQVTTQKGIRSAVHPLHRRYRTKQQ